jgi:hypothetical protein
MCSKYFTYKIFRIIDLNALRAHYHPQVTDSKYLAQEWGEGDPGRLRFTR